MTRQSSSDRDSPDQRSAPPSVRIVGGRFRGRRLAYNGDPRTRPMKDRVREALFNLVGPQVAGMHALDLFAGTGAIGLEALSRGAARATLVEQHGPTAQVIRQNIAALEVADLCDVAVSSAFVWLKRWSPRPTEPWLVLCSPPFEFFDSRAAEMTELIGQYLDAAPAGSVFVVESPETFDCSLLPSPTAWDVRLYSPAQLAICSKEDA